jgi:chromosome segregation ATPase
MPSLVDHDGFVEVRDPKDDNNTRIAKQLGQLAQANNRVHKLEKKEIGAKAQLEIMERKVLVAQREAKDAKQQKQAREDNLRDIIAKHKWLEQDHEEIQGKLVSLQEYLEQAKKKVSIRKEDAKIARTRSAGSHNQYKKLQAQHGEALELISEQIKQLEESAFLQQ